MRKFLIVLLVLFLPVGWGLYAQQLPNANFEDWSGSKFDGNIQPASWHASNVTQFGFKFNFAHRETGHSGYCMMVKDQDIGAAGITETSPGYFSLGQPWVYIESLTKVSYATAGTYGGVEWTYRPDTMAVWIKRTGNNTDKEEFHLLYYSWTGTAKGDKYKGKNGSCTSTSKTNEESDIRLSTDGNECGTVQKASQVAEGWHHEKKSYGDWTLVKVPIFYMGEEVPEMCNIIFSASNYPNFRANSGLYDGNSLYIDDVSLIYASTIQTLYIDGLAWNGFNPNTEEEQVYSLGDNATTIPDIYAMRGAGSLINSKGVITTFPGRRLSGEEISIQKGKVGEVTTITVKSEDGKSKTTYRIRFMKAASSNAYLSALWLKSSQEDSTMVVDFNPYTTSCEIELPYGTKVPPTLSVTKQETLQSVAISQAKTLTDKATIVVTAADKKTKRTYTVSFVVAQLSDNTLQDILVDGVSVAGFMPNQTTYRVSLPLGTLAIPDVKAISAYPQGAQTIVYKAPEVLDGGVYQISVTTPGNQIAKTYKLNFKLEASTYSKLKDLQVGDGLISDFTPDQYIYYITLPMGTDTVPAIHYVAGDAYQTVSVAKGGVNGTSLVTVKAASGAQSVYKIICTTPLSEENRLKNIFINGTALEGFNPDVRLYNVLMPIDAAAFPKITWETMDAYQTVTLAEGGFGGTTRLTVKAGDGSTLVYQLLITKQQSSNCSLNMIYVDGVELAGFSSDSTEYEYHLPQGAVTAPEVTYTAGDAYQKITVRKPTGLTGYYRLTVRAGNGDTKTYSIQFVQKKSANTALQMIRLDGQPLENFHPDTLNYTVYLSTSKLPVVTVDKAESLQKVLNVVEGTTQTITITAENGDKRIYTIYFVVQKSENAFLDMIYLDGDSLPGFQKDQLTYTIQMQTEVCPVITTAKGDGLHVLLTAPQGAGDAQIVVRTESGEENIYLLTFVASAVCKVQLRDILLDGESLPGFLPSRLEYDQTYRGVLPEVTPVVDEGQTAEVLSRDSIVSIYVAAGDAHATYTIRFHRYVSNDCSLQGIRINGNPLESYLPDVLDYTIPLAAGATLPEVTYVRNHAEQVVYFGTKDEMTTQIIVTAEDGISQHTYTIHFDRAKYSDAHLQNISSEQIAIPFREDQLDYDLAYDAGLALPELTITAKPGQTVFVNTVNAANQEVLVTAEDGTTLTYRIHYTRTLSDNAYLKDILLDGVSVDNFDSAVYAYVDTLDWRTAVVPCVHPVGMIPAQQITTYHSSVNGTTRIHVLAPDGLNERNYYISFPVRQSSNTRLAELAVDMEGEFRFHPDSLNYHVVLPSGSTEVPAIMYTKEEEEQQIRFVSRPLGQTSDIIVTAENGATRAYHILFTVAASTEANLLQSIYIVEIDKSLNLRDKTIRDFEVVLPYGTQTMTVDYTKVSSEQTVLVQPGGTRRPTILTVKSNRMGDTDVVYTITPQLTTQNPAILTGISVDGTSIPDFEPNRFSYVVNRAKTSSPKVTITKASGVEYDPTTDLWRSDIVVSKDGYSNTYHIIYHYENDVIPNGEFTSWTKTAKSGTDKPTSWNAPGDYINKYLGTAKAGDAVQKSGDSAVGLETTYWAALAGPVPAVINLGDMNATFAVAGGTRVTPSGSIGFHNTPDVAEINYKYPSKAGNGALFRFKFFDTDGQAHTFDHKQTSSESSYASHTLPLSTNGVAVNGMDIIIDATGKYPDGSSDAKLYVDYIRFGYDHTLKSVKANGIDATLDGTTFTATLVTSEDVNLPSLEFIGAVTDQAQKLTWTSLEKENEYELRKGTIQNIGEDGQSTRYDLIVKRPLCTTASLSEILVGGQPLSGFSADKKDYIYPLRRGQVTPDVCPTPASFLQTVVTSYRDSVVTIAVTPEYGETATYTITFRVERSSNTALAYLSDVKDFDPAVHTYTIEADKMPDLRFVKAEDIQTVDMHHGHLTVTAEDGSQAEYTVLLQAPEYVSSAQLAELQLEGQIWQDFKPTTYAYSHARPSWTSFVRQYNRDSVVYSQCADSMVWKVLGGGTTHTYTMTYQVVKSSSTSLNGIYVGNDLIPDFEPSVLEYTLPTDTAVFLRVEKQNDKQNVQVSYAENTYTIDVTAEDGSEGTYILHLVPDLSGDATLSMIMLDSVAIPDFRSDSLSYHILIPSPDVKIEEPALPSVQYRTTQSSATVEVQSGALGAPTYLMVRSENGLVDNVYEVLVVSEPSHNAYLTGIVINDVPVDRFEAGRHYYSALSSTGDINLQWSADDRFQTYRVDTIGTKYFITVTAQDGVTTEQYEVDVYLETLPMDATLSNILLDDSLEMQYYLPSLNKNLHFDPNNNTYSINLPSCTTVWPKVSAQLKMDGQSVEIRMGQNVDSLIVTAKDGIHQNTYTISFLTPPSSDARIKMIRLDGDSLPEFSPDQHFYAVSLPVGVHRIPEIYAEKGESHQTIGEVEISGLQANIRVTAEDGTEGVYTLLFSYTLSDEANLQMIYANNDSLLGFRPDLYNYYIDLPIGSTSFPVLSYDSINEWQTISSRVVVNKPLQRITQIEVLAESGIKNTYTISYSILLDEVDTLRRIDVNHALLPGFDPYVIEYFDTLPAGTYELPLVEVEMGSPYQDVRIDTLVETLDASKFLDYKIQITVEAENQSRRVYMIHFPVALSENTQLAMILHNGASLSDFVEGVYDYQVAVPYNPSGQHIMPSITVVKAEEGQNVELVAEGDSLFLIHVLAENGVASSMYRVRIEYGRSPSAALSGILVGGQMLPGFSSDSMEYHLTYFRTDTVPAMQWIPENLGQSLSVSESRYRVSDTIPVVQYTCDVTSSDGEHFASYTVVMQFSLTAVDTMAVSSQLSSLYLFGVPVSVASGFDSDFHPDTLTYNYRSYPIRTRNDALFTEDDITYTTLDPLAKVDVQVINKEVLTDTFAITPQGEVVFRHIERSILLTVSDRYGLAPLQYVVHQAVELSRDSAITEVYFGADGFMEFEPNTHAYIRPLKEGTTAPGVTCVASDNLAYCDISYQKVETENTIEKIYTITCLSEYAYIYDRSNEKYKNVYTFRFVESAINESQRPFESDVLLKHIPHSTQVLLASLRSNVQVGFYDMNGQMVLYRTLQAIDPGNAVVSTDGYNQEYLADVLDVSKCTILTLEPNRIYFYCFLENGKRKIKSGKIIITK